MFKIIEQLIRRIRDESAAVRGKILSTTAEKA